MSEIKLLPCPFCGGEAKVRGEKFYQPNVRRNVICTKCFSSGGWYKTEEEAIEKWNTRKPMQEIVERLEEERNLLKHERNEAIEYDDEQIIYATNNQIRAFDYSIRVVKEVGRMNEN